MLRNVKIDLLRQVALFKGCSKRELGEIARIADEIDFPEGKTLITQGEPGKQCFVLIEGSVDVVKGGKKVPEMRGGSEIFGEIALLSGGPSHRDRHDHDAGARARDRAAGSSRACSNAGRRSSAACCTR